MCELCKIFQKLCNSENPGQSYLAPSNTYTMKSPEKTNPSKNTGEIIPGKNDMPGYPLYPSSDDIYNKYHKEGDVDPEDITKKRTAVPRPTSGKNNEQEFADDMSGSDLDVPGSELDDEQENLGSEDEENNYYSIGGDDHNDLDEYKGE